MLPFPAQFEDPSLRLMNSTERICSYPKIFTHFKKAPGTHKLGVLYVVDFVTRQWVEAARKAGQPPGNAAPDGTFAAGANRVTGLLPVLMTDIINHAPYDQKVHTRHPRAVYHTLLNGASAIWFLLYALRLLS